MARPTIIAVNKIGAARATAWNIMLLTSSIANSGFMIQSSKFKVQSSKFKDDSSEVKEARPHPVPLPQGEGRGEGEPSFELNSHESFPHPPKLSTIERTTRFHPST